MADSRHMKILEEIQSEIRGLDLKEIKDENVTIMTVPETGERNIKGYPGVLLGPFGIENLQGQGTNASEDIGYPCAVILVDKRPTTSEEPLDKWLKWREDIVDHFIHNRQLFTTILSSVHDITWEPSSIAETAAWFGKQKFVSSFTLRVQGRYQRRAS